MFIHLSVCGHILSDSITTMQYAVMKLCRCAVGIKIKAVFEDGCGQISEILLMYVWH